MSKMAKALLEEEITTLRQRVAELEEQLSERRESASVTQVEQSLRESEERYRGFVSQAYDAFTLTDEQGMVIEWNQAAERLTGVAACEVLGQFAWDVQLRFHPPEKNTEEMRDLMRQQIEAVLKAGDGPILGGYEAKIKHPDGQEIITGQKLFTIKTSKGFQLGSIAYDLTAERQAEEKLRESEARYRLLFENMNEGFALQEIIQDETGRVVDFRTIDANPAYEQHTGQKLEKIIGHTLREVTPNADPAMIERYGEVALTGKPLDFEYYSKTFDRHIRVRSFRPQPNHFASVFEDITKHKQAEQVLRESEVRFSTIFRSSNDAISIARLKDDVYLDVNDAFCNTFGFTREEVIGHTGKELNFSSDPMNREKLIEIIRDQGSISNFEAQYRHRNGQTGYMLISGRTVNVSGQECVVIFGKNITLSKQAEQALRESERKFSTLFQKSPNAISLARSADGVIMDVNEAFEKLYGRNRTEVIGKPSTMLGVAADANTRARLRAEIQAHGFVRDFEYQIFDHADAVRDVLLNIDSIELNGQKYLLTITQDVTERKQAEAALQAAHDELEQRVAERTAELRQSEEKFSKAFYDAPIARVIGREIDKVFVDVNDHYLELFECRREQIIGHSSTEFNFYPDTHAREELARVLFKEQGRLDNFEMRARTYSGKEVDLLISTTPIYLNGMKYNMVAYVDITERKHLENELRESEQKYTTLFEKSATPTVLLELPETVIRKANASAEKLTGYTSEEMFGRTAVDLGLLTLQERLQAIEIFEKQGRLQGHELRMTTKAGEERIVFTTTVPVTIGGKSHAISSLIDITERKRAEQKLIETNAALEKALRAKNEFMAAMTHELRTPLTGILGMSEVLKMPHYDPLTERQLKAVNTIEGSGERLLELVTDILDYTQLQSRDLSPTIEDCLLGDVCQSALKIMQPISAKRNQKISCKTAPEKITLRTDARQLRQILLHLLRNASKFTPEGGEFGVTVNGDQNEHLVAITVWDKGIGIQEEDLPKLFQPFVQLDARLARQYEGSGLGLVLSKQRAELLGGNVSVTSVFGEGSRFTVTLPWNE